VEKEAHMETTYIKKMLTSAQIIILGFAGVILIGSLVLMLPIASRNGEITPFIDALFTATSATCVTGLIVVDTATHWSFFGQAVILLLIQIGGMGVITVAVALAMISKKRITLMQRSLMQDFISAPKVGGIVRLTGFIIRGVLFLELLGAILMAPIFVRDYGTSGIWMGIFHSISAFCNAGFDILGRGKPFSSLTSYAGDPVINITIMLLIIIGGLGFITWEDMKLQGIHLRKYRMQSKVILSMTVILIFVPAMYFFLWEFGEYPIKERFLVSLFQAVTPRTAGFNTIPLDTMSEAGQGIEILLMLIGGSPGSTAGGMKTTTVAVLFSTAFAVFRRKECPQYFGRRIAEEAIKAAATILLLYVGLFFVGAMVISRIEDLPLITCMYETASAIGTVGMTLGITSQLGLVSKMILISFMYFGRVGGLTLIFAAIPEKSSNLMKLPQEKITVG
jgi:trk system potassium uptake protein TrkH